MLSLLKHYPVLSSGCVPSNRRVRAYPPLRQNLIRRRKLSYEKDHTASVCCCAGGLRPIRTCRHRNGGVIGGRSRAAEGVASAVQAGSRRVGRCAVQPRVRSDTQAVLWRRQRAVHAIGEPTNLLIVGSSSHIFCFLAQHAATRFRLLRFSCFRRCANSCLFLDLCPDNGL